MATYYIEKDKLEGEYKEAFERIEAYSMLKGIDADTDEEMMMNMVDMLYTAQINGKPAGKIVGDDIEQFCKDYFQDLGEIKLDKIIKRIPRFLRSISWTIIVMCLLEIIFPEEKVRITKASLDISGVIFGSIVGFIISMIIIYVGQRVLFKVKKINATVLSFAYIFLIFACGVFLSVFYAMTGL